MRRFVAPYKKYLGWAILLNILSAVLNVFSFTLIIPILQILFKMDNKVYEFIPWDSGASLKEIGVNNFLLLCYPNDPDEWGVTYLTLFRIISCFYDTVENVLLFCFFSCNGPITHRGSS